MRVVRLDRHWALHNESKQGTREMNWISEVLSKLSASDWAAWIQAFGVFVAIYFTSSVARTQSEKQYKNSINLKAIEEYEKRLMLTESVTEIFKNASNRIKYIEVQLADRKAIYDVATKRKYYDLDCLTDILGAFKQIPLHDLSSAKLVSAVMHSIATIRQLDIQVDKSLTEARTMNAEDFDKVLITIKEVSASMESTCSDVLKFYEELKLNPPNA